MIRRHFQMVAVYKHILLRRNWIENKEKRNVDRENSGVRGNG